MPVPAQKSTPIVRKYKPTIKLSIAFEIFQLRESSKFPQKMFLITASLHQGNLFSKAQIAFQYLKRVHYI